MTQEQFRLSFNRYWIVVVALVMVQVAFTFLHGSYRSVYMALTYVTLAANIATVFFWQRYALKDVLLPYYKQSGKFSFKDFLLPQLAYGILLAGVYMMAFTY